MPCLTQGTNPHVSFVTLHEFRRLFQMRQRFRFAACRNQSRRYIHFVRRTPGLQQQHFFEDAQRFRQLLCAQLLRKSRYELKTLSWSKRA